MAKVSIIMNCYNGEEYLHQAIDSIFAQTYTDWKIIFVDNCSVDSSAEIAASYGDKVTIVKTKKNIPLYEARNFGLDFVRESEYVGFLDVDDLWAEDKLERQLKLFEGNVAMVYSKIKAIDEYGHKLTVQMPKLYRGQITQKLLLSNFIAISALLVKASVIRSLKFNSQYNLVGDYDLWLRIAAEYEADYVDDFLFFSRRHSSNMTKKYKGLWIKEIRNHYFEFLKTYKFRFPNIFVYILKSEIGNFIGRY